MMRSTNALTTTTAGRWSSASRVLLLSLSFWVSCSYAEVRINEISDKGTSTVCDSHDWVELYNDGDAAVDLSKGYLLHDDKGMNDATAFTFANSVAMGGVLEAGGYLLLCSKMELLVNPNTLQFGISGSDTISLVRVTSNLAEEEEDDNNRTAIGRQSTTDTTGAIYTILSSVALPNTDDAFDVTYAYDNFTGVYQYTSTPTPGAANVMTAIPTQEEQIAAKRQAMKDQAALGTAFFGYDQRGYMVKDAMDPILELHVTMADIDYNYMMANKSFETYRAFESAQLTTLDKTKVLSNLTSPGRIRPKGQSTLYIPICLGTDTTPFQLDFADTNSSQTLFGVEKIYLRHHMGDYSYLRDYAYNRMLAMYGLPHLRTRKVVFYINGQKFGYYNLMEATDQEYVFARSFPKYNPDAFALYKMKSVAMDCGAYTQESMALAETRLDETATPPYAFQRGEHNDIVPALGMFAANKCVLKFVDKLFDQDYNDVVLAYQRYDKDCSEMLMEEGLIDRDLGTKDYNKVMKSFIHDHYRGDIKCDKNCANSDLASEVDLDNFLKMFAFYAVVVNSDSPLINGNNFYLAQAGDEEFGGSGGWKIVPYDFNAARVVFCHTDTCTKRMVHWVRFCFAFLLWVSLLFVFCYE